MTEECARFCVDCKQHAIRFVGDAGQVVQRHVCNRKAFLVRDLVTGTTSLKGYAECTYERENRKTVCGPEGKFWEKKGD